MVLLLFISKFVCSFVEFKLFIWLDLFDIISIFFSFWFDSLFISFNFKFFTVVYILYMAFSENSSCNDFLNDVISGDSLHKWIIYSARTSKFFEFSSLFKEFCSCSGFIIAFILFFKFINFNLLITSIYFFYFFNSFVYIVI